MSRRGLILPVMLFMLLFFYAASAKAEDAPDNKRLAITVEDSILLTLQNNRALKMNKITPLIRQTFEDEEQAVFETLISGGSSVSRERGQRVSTSGSVIENTINSSETSLGVSRYLPTGTTIGIGVSTQRLYSDLSRDQHTSRLGMTLTQALLEGRGMDANLADLRQARLDTGISEYEFQGLVLTVIAGAEKAYWDYYLALRQVDIYRESLMLADRQLNEAVERIEVGMLAETERTAADAEKALRNEDLINARSELEKERLRFLRLMNPPGMNIWDREIELLDKPDMPETGNAEGRVNYPGHDTVESHVKLAFKMRPDLNQAALEIEKGDIAIVKTKNGLLPMLDFFLTPGKSNYAESFSGSVDVSADNFYDVLAGVRLELPVGNRGKEAGHRRAILGRGQAEEAMENLKQLAELDVRTAMIEISRTKEQITATAASRKLQAEKLDIETEKYRVGRSTMLLVAQAQRDLVASRVSEAEAKINYLKALIELYRLDGSLLQRRGISISSNK